ncbi:hypothetical protein GCM10010124_25400 [Pilimelia terevasa]|uniref:Uncharacterized protein n=1 Tax=Pilimelia terevasa TaxID=53372 RepID=A0A8J3BV01_9ACTN|nr:ParA family protein [Pilimelia terevasa]GGK31517.1 hypothetical protein GCM10010124_25400 [Pilimelia terevasa]
MAVIALCSAKGSPGVSLAALALTLSWPAPVVLAEADPAGGDALAGFLAGQVTADRGTAELAVANARGRLRDEFDSNLIDLAPPAERKLLLPGVASPVAAEVVADIGADLADLFADLGRGRDATDVIVDCGRITAPHVLWPVIAAADLAVLVVRSTLPSLAHAQHGLAQLDAARADAVPVELLVMDDGPYVREAGRRLDAPVLDVWPWAPRAARRLSFGGSLGRGNRLMIEAQRTARALHTRIRSSAVAHVR